MEQQYLDLCRRIIEEGEWVTNSRTGKRCLTVIDANLEYDVRDGTLPILTTKKTFWKSAIAEMLGYLRGLTNAADFRALGTKTWDANANETAAWLESPYRQGVDHMGDCYGAQLRRFHDRDGKPFDQLRKVYEDLRKGYDDRREIMTFWNPAEINRACLAACMHTHTWSILNGHLYLTSYQRSYDAPLGGPFNAIQVAWLLMVMAQITGLKPGKAFHKIVNAHIYEDQVELMRDVQLTREPFEPPKLALNPDIRTLEDLETWVTVDDFSLVGEYRHHPAIKYPFSA